MKAVRTLIFFLILSVAVSYGVYSVNSDTIINSSVSDIAGEIGIIAIPVFLVLVFLNAVARMLGKAVKKKPSE